MLTDRFECPDYQFCCCKNSGPSHDVPTVSVADEHSFRSWPWEGITVLALKPKWPCIDGAEGKLVLTKVNFRTHDVSTIGSVDSVEQHQLRCVTLLKLHYLLQSATSVYPCAIGINKTRDRSNSIIYNCSFRMLHFRQTSWRRANSNIVELTF